MKLSVIISNRNDLVMLNITVNSAIEAIKSLDHKAEIVICDNSDQRQRSLIPVVLPIGFKRHGNVKTIYEQRPSFTLSRMKAAEAASGEYLFCVDSHVLFGHDTLRKSLDFMERHKDNKLLGFAHPPIRWAHQGPQIKRHTLALDKHGTPWGAWDKTFKEESKMFWKFMPWICRRDWYLNILRGYGSHSTHELSWGGAEMLQQVKALMLGYENWAIPSDPITHIGPYTPEVVKVDSYKYRTYANSGKFPHGFGVLVSFAVLGGSTDGYNHAKLCEERILNRHHIKVDEYWQRATDVAAKEHKWLEANKKYNYLELLNTKPWES